MSIHRSRRCSCGMSAPCCQNVFKIYQRPPDKALALRLGELSGDLRIDKPKKLAARKFLNPKIIGS